MSAKAVLTNIIIITLTSRTFYPLVHSTNYPVPSSSKSYSAVDHHNSNKECLSVAQTSDLQFPHTAVQSWKALPPGRFMPFAPFVSKRPNTYLLTSFTLKFLVIVSWYASMSVPRTLILASWLW